MASPLPDQTSIGFAPTEDIEAVADLAAGLEARSPSALSRRTAQLDAFEREAMAGADDAGPGPRFDTSSIALGANSGVVYEERAFENGTRQRIHYSDGQEIGAQGWNPDGSYWERWGRGNDVWRIDADDHVTESRTMSDEATIEQRQGEGTVRYIWPGGSDEVHTLLPNGDIEIIDYDSGSRILLHPDNSTTEYRGDGRIIHTPPPKQGTGGGEGEGESAPKDDQQTEQQQSEEHKRQEEEAERRQEEHDDQSSEGSGGAGEGEDEGSQESASRPDVEVDPAVEALLAAGRAFGFHPGAARRHGSTGTGGDVDPADPTFDGGLDAGGPLIDLKERLLIGPRDPDIVGGTGRSTIPDSIRPDGGVIDPSDDAAGGLGEMGPEDDLFGGLRPGLEPAPPDGDDASSTAFRPISPPLGAFRELDLPPSAPGLVADFEELDD